MRVLLISANTETINMVPLPLGLNLVAVAARNAGHDVELLDLMGSGDLHATLEAAISRQRPGVIGISVRNVDDQKMDGTKFLLEPVRHLVAACRALSDAPIVLGGSAFGIFPRAILQYLKADMGVCGEGETTFVELLAALDQARDPATIPGVVLPLSQSGGHVPRPSLDRLPLPDPSLWHVPAEVAADLWIPFQTRRGCPMKCSYCSTPALEGTSIRRHPVDRVVETLRRHTDAGFHRFYCVDNTFNFPPDYAKALCRGIIEAALPVEWRAILYPGFADEELVELMAKAGCVEVSVGFESGSQRILRQLGKRYTPQQVRKTVDLLSRHGIRRMGFLLLGGPGETRQSVLESLAFADSLNLDMMKVSCGIRIYPGTPLAATAQEEGVIEDDDDLLQPRFYLAQGMEEWLPETLGRWMSARPWCTT